MKIESLLSQAIEQAQAEGIQIRRGAHFDWTKAIAGGVPVRVSVPTSCNATGAVLWTLGKATESHQIKILCDYLDVDTWWLYRFWMGFDRNYQILIKDENNVTIGSDEVSSIGIKLAKKYVRISEKMVPRS